MEKLTWNKNNIPSDFNRPEVIWCSIEIKSWYTENTRRYYHKFIQMYLPIYLVQTPRKSKYLIDTFKRRSGKNFSIVALKANSKMCFLKSKPASPKSQGFLNKNYNFTNKTAYSTCEYYGEIWKELCILKISNILNK